MHIFEHFRNEKFFRPLASKHRHILCDVMDELINMSREYSPLHERDAKDRISMLLMRRGKADDLNKDVHEIFSILKDSGWIEEPEVSRSGEYITVLSYDAVKLIGFLHQMADKSEDLSASDIFRLYDTSEYLDGRDPSRRYYDDLLVPMQEDVIHLKESLSTLKNNIKYVISDIVGRHSSKTLMKYLAEDYFKKVFSEYFYIKQKGFTNGYLLMVADRLLHFEEDPEKVRFAAKQFAEKHDPGDDPPEEHILRMAEQMRDFLRFDFNDYMDDIDQVWSHCMESLNMQLTIAIRFEEDQRAMVANMLDALKMADEADAEAVLEEIAENMRIYQQKYIGMASLEPFRKTRSINERKVFEESEMSDEEIAKATEEVIASEAYNVRKKTEAFVERNMKGEVLIPGKKTVSSRDEGLLIADLISMVSSNNDRFQPYTVELTGKDVEGEDIVFSGIVIKRKKEGK